MTFLTLTKKNTFLLLTHNDVITVLTLHAPRGRGLAVTKEIAAVYNKDVLFGYYYYYQPPLESKDTFRQQ